MAPEAWDREEGLGPNLGAAQGAAGDDNAAVGVVGSGGGRGGRGCCCLNRGGRRRSCGHRPSQLACGCGWLLQRPFSDLRPSNGRRASDDRRLGCSGTHSRRSHDCCSGGSTYIRTRSGRWPRDAMAVWLVHRRGNYGLACLAKYWCGPQSAGAWLYAGNLDVRRRRPRLWLCFIARSTGGRSHCARVILLLGLLLPSLRMLLLVARRQIARLCRDRHHIGLWFCFRGW